MLHDGFIQPKETMLGDGNYPLPVSSGPLASGLLTKYTYGELKEAMNPENTTKKITLLRAKTVELYQVQQELGNQ